MKYTRSLCGLRRQMWLCATLLLTLVMASLPLSAQSTQGAIIGSVKDQAGAYVAGAVVKLTSTEEGTVRTAKSNVSGEYRFQDAKAGHYSLEVTAPGFERWTVYGVVLAVRQERRIDIALSVGTVQQSITVTSDQVSSIETDTPTISAEFTADDTMNLPVNTRASFSGTSAYNILGTLPGMENDSSGFSLQGALPFQVDVTIDGLTAKSTAGNSVVGDMFPSSEAISEIRADGAMNNAEFGDPGQVIVTTKGGTNQFHGSAFWYYQSSAFNAIAYTYPTTITKPSQHGNTYGASVGGPVILPHYNGHNKSFFYGGYEGWRHPAQTTISGKVPTPAMKDGDFSNYFNADGSQPTLTNPLTGASATSVNVNTIAASVLKQFYPDPLSSLGSTTTYIDNDTANWQANVDKSAHSDQFDVRGDQYFGSNQKFLLWGRFTWKNFPTHSEEMLSVPSQLDQEQSRVLKIDTNWTISPNLINEGGFGLAYLNNETTDSFDGASWTNKQGWNGLSNLYYNGIPEMDFNNITSLTADRLSGKNQSKTFDYSDTLIWTKGRHTAKFGVNIQHLIAVTPLGFSGADNYGTYQFNTSKSKGMFTGVDFADFLMGLPYQTFYDVVHQDNNGLSNHYHVFAQDEWRVNDKLTLSFGVRYELHPGYYDKYGDIGNFDPTVAKSGRVIYPQGKSSLLAQNFLAAANACDPDGVNKTNSSTVNGAACMEVVGNSDAGYPAGLKKFPHLRFMPRFGFAYRPLANDKWSVRGGAGLYNINLLGTNFYSLTGTIQADTQQYTNTYNSNTHAIGYQWPNIYAGSNGTSYSYGTDYFGTANSINWKDPYTEQWSLSVDHDFGSGYAGRVSYIGSETHQLVWAPDENTLPFSSTVASFNNGISNRLFPNWGRINTRATGANASYNSLQLEISHRLQHGTEFHSTFTWAKALADNQGPNNTSFGAEGGGGRATSILDRHVDFGDVYGTRRLHWNTTALYDLPFGRGKQIGGGVSRLTDAVIGGWRLSGILLVETGPYETPYFPAGEGDPSGTGSGMNGEYGDGTGSYDGGHRAQHADRVAGVSINPTGKNRMHWANGAAFTCPGDSSWTVGSACGTGAGYTPSEDDAGNITWTANSSHPLPIGRFGNSGVGTILGPGLVNLSAGLSKSVTLTDHLKFKLEGTFTNVLNHANLGDPNLDLSSSTFGRVTKAISSDFGGARTGQVSARLEF